MPAPAIGGIVLDGGVPRIVAAGGELEVAALTSAEGADLVELRADLFDDPTPEKVVAALERLRPAGRPVILTARAAREGGNAMDEERRRALYAAGLPHAHAIDVEIASAELVAELAPQAQALGRTLILSAHALDRTPPERELLALVDRAAGLGADLTKLATQPRDVADVQTLLAVTLAARGRGIVTVGMGPAGPLSRVVLAAAGSLFTYASVGRPTAAGQMPVGELAGLFRRLYPHSA
jgi:3-dehydroquinate dehydratase-1